MKFKHQFMDKSTYQVLFWQVIAQVPAGKVVTYGQVAELAGLPGMARAVGRTLSQLPEDTKLPWYRVVNAQGKLSLPVDSLGWKRQKAQLEEEGIVLINGRIKLSHFQWQP